MTRPPSMIGMLLAAVLASGPGCRQSLPNPQPPAPGSAPASAVRPAPGRSLPSREGTQLAGLSADPQSPAPRARPAGATSARPAAKLAELPLYLPPPPPSRPARQPLWQQRAKNY